MSTDACEIVKNHSEWREEIMICLIEHECLDCDHTERIYMTIHPRNVAVIHAFVCQVEANATINRIPLNAKVKMNVEVDKIQNESDEKCQEEFADRRTWSHHAD